MSVTYDDEQTLEFAKKLILSFSNEEDAPIIELMFSGSNRDVWITAFTHRYKDPEHNFERLESLGDAVLKTYFKKFIFQYYPQYDESDFTNLQNVYMATDEQRKIANILGLTEFMRLAKFSGNPDPEKIQMLKDQAGADILESFFGAISDTADSIGAEEDGEMPGRKINGIGELICTNFIYKIFSGDNSIIKIRDIDRYGNINTIVIQMMEKLGVGYNNAGVSGAKGKTVFSESYMKGKGGKRTLVLSLNNEQLARLNEKVKEINPDAEEFESLEGAGRDGDKKTAATQAYQNIYEMLGGQGITRETVSNHINSKRFEEVRNIREIKRLKLDYLTVEEDNKTKITTSEGVEGVYQLLGHKIGKPAKILYTTLMPVNEIEKSTILKKMVELYVAEITPPK